MVIGILLPFSKAHPGIGLDFMDGINSYLTQQGLNTDITIRREGIGFGAVEKEVFEKAEKLLVTDDVDILVAYVDEKVTALLYSLVQSTGKLLLVVNPGANYPLNWVAQPTVIHLDLQHAFLCRLTGALAAGNEDKGAVYASSFYDCGYLHAAAMVNHFVGSGGAIRYNYINNQAYNDHFDINPLSDFLSDNPGCNNILGVYDELPASLFYQRLNVLTGDHALRLYVSPMMLQEKALVKPDTGFGFSIEGFLPWQPGQEGENNKIFVRSCKRPASIFSLLGWETAILLGTIHEKFSGSYQDGEAIVAHLKNTLLQGPRGDMKLDAETLYYMMPFGRFSMEAGDDKPVMNWLPFPEAEWRTFTALSTEGAVSGWMNTYLCY